MRIKVVSFYTEGQPYDEGANLAQGMYAFRQIVEDNGYLFDGYTPSRLSLLGADCFSRVFPEELKYEVNQHSHKIGFLAWKPFIIYDALRDMDDGDVVFYLDANIKKYPSLRDMLENARSVSDLVTKDYDFYIGREFIDQSFPLLQFAHQEAINELGGGTDFVKNFPNLIANNIVCKKTRFSEGILLDWISFCLVDRFLYIQDKGRAQHVDFKWSCAEQSVINCIIARHIQEGMLPWNYPGISYGRGSIARITDNSHVKYLEKEKYIPEKPKLREEFSGQIEKTKELLSDIYSGKFIKKMNFLEIELNEKNIFHTTRKPEKNGLIFYNGKKSESIIVEENLLKNKEVLLSIDVRMDLYIPAGIMVKTNKEDICLAFRDKDPALTSNTVDCSVNIQDKERFTINYHFFTKSSILEIEIRDYLGYYYMAGNEVLEISNISIKCRDIAPLTIRY